MTKFLQLITALIASFFLLSSCSRDVLRGQGSTVTETRDLPAFTQVETAGTTTIRMVYGAAQKVETKAYANLLPFLETTVSNGVLRIGYKTNTLIQNDNSEVTITIPSLSAIRSFGTSSIQATGNFNSPTLEIRVSGTGEVQLQDMQARMTRVISTGTGRIRAYGLQTGKADIQQSGTGNTEITVMEELKARLSGTGNIYYKGNPRLDVRMEGTGNIVKK
jgi:hypothetical protein